MERCLFEIRVIAGGVVVVRIKGCEGNDSFRATFGKGTATIGLEEGECVIRDTTDPDRFISVDEDGIAKYTSKQADLTTVLSEYIATQIFAYAKEKSGKITETMTFVSDNPAKVVTDTDDARRAVFARKDKEAEEKWKAKLVGDAEAARAARPAIADGNPAGGRRKTRRRKGKSRKVGRRY